MLERYRSGKLLVEMIHLMVRKDIIGLKSRVIQ